MRNRLTSIGFSLQGAWAPRPWLGLLLLVLPGCASGNFTIHPDQPVGPPLVGFGAQLNPYLYCRPNYRGPSDDASLADLEAKIIAFHPQTVRIFVLKQWFDGRMDPISKGDARTVESFFRVVELAQRAGATVNLTYWYEPHWKKPKEKMVWFANLVATMRHRFGLTCVRYLTIQNEPNGHEKSTPMDLMAGLYRDLDQDLRRAGVRDEVGIISGDLVRTREQAWFEMLGRRLGAISDGYSIHVYWDYWDTPKILHRLDGPREIVDSLPPDEQKPLFVTEFGVRGQNKDFKTNDPGDYKDGAPIATKPLQANELARFVLDGLNRGYVAFVVWTMSDAFYDHPMKYGLVGTAADGWPLKPGYHMLRLLTHTIEPGWRAVKVEGSADGLIVSAVRGPDGAMALLALNITGRQFHARIAGIPSPLRAIYEWNARGDGLLTHSSQPALTADSSIELTIPAGAMVVATTRQPAL